MWIPLSKSVALSMMITCLFASIKLGAFISISIALGCTFVSICTFMDDYIPTSDISSSSMSFCTTCVSTDHYSTPSSPSNFSMFTGSTNVALGPTCTLELQPLLCLRKNSTADVLVLHIFWIIVYANCIFSLYTLPFHILKMMVNAATTLLPTVKCSTLLYSLLFSTFLLLLFFPTHMFLIPIFICVTSLCFLLFCYFLQFFNHIFCTHASMNSRTSKKHITCCNKWKQVSIVTFCPWTSCPLPSFFDLLVVF